MGNTIHLARLPAKGLTAGLFALALALAGCTIHFHRKAPPLPPAERDATLYYGRIELPEGMPLGSVTVFEVGRVYAGSVPFTRSWQEGYFLREGMPPGEYFPASFFADGSRNHFSWTGDQVLELARPVRPGRCTFLGTFTITNMKTRRFTGSGSFEVGVSQHRRDEKQVLAWLIQTLDGTGWDTRLKKRLARL